MKELIKETSLYDIFWKIKNYFLYQMYKRFSEHLPLYEIKRLINKENPIIVEVGANSGSDSIRFLYAFGNCCKLYCIEPYPPAIVEFQKTINFHKKVHPNIDCKLFEVAISDKNGFTDFNIHKNLTDGSLKKIKNATGKIKVKTITLDNWTKENKIDTIDFLWIDIEGSEKELIEGGLKTLKKTRFLFLEYVPDRTIWKNQIKLKDITNLLPDFEVIGVFNKENILLKNIRLGVEETK